ncbi:MAG: glutamate--tRNA ligase family protein [bacterium]|nr:glutamate--tRNA ligase family protein [bacterium]
MTSDASTTDHAQLAALLFPHIDKTPADWLAHYPPRPLPPGAFVTRYAPSPTGFVHIGSIYASLVARRAAHQTGGVFFLRIEDTDKKREQDGSIEKIVANMINFGLQPDEGIVQVNPEIELGAYAPYTQSERVEIYETFAKDLVARGLAYPAFDTDAELDAMRRAQEAQNAKPGYYGEWARWRSASLEQVRAKLEAGERPAIRVRAPYPNAAHIQLEDEIRGFIDMPANDTDAVLLKSSNRLPTYHFAHVVDDTLMRVNLVTRGDEWLPSVPLHLQLFSYIGQPAPKFAHIAPIAKMDGTARRKLSKRKDPEADMTYYYQAGYPEQAVTEYLLNLANSSFQDWRRDNPRTPNHAFGFSIHKMGVAPPLFDLVKLNDISKNVIATFSAAEVYGLVQTWANKHDPRIAAVLAADPAYSEAVFNVERMTASPRKDIVNWSDVERAVGFFFDPLFADAVARDGYPMPEYPRQVITAILDHVAGFDPAQPKEIWLAEMRTFAEAHGFARDAKTYKQAPDQFHGHFGDMMMVVRVGLTARTNTPDLHEIMHTLGTERVRARIAQARAYMSSDAQMN